MSFNYSGIRYWYVSITDTEFENIYLQYPDGNYNYRENCLLVVSLGDMYTALGSCPGHSPWSFNPQHPEPPPPIMGVRGSGCFAVPM